jgi:hypothetical protein
MADALTLSQILGRGVSLDWHEGVAIVRGVMEWLTTRNQTSVAPDLDQIQILSSGRIEVTRGSKVDEPVRRLGQLLHATIGNADPPVKLRLVISEAMAPTPVFGSIREFDQALEYFERPDRAAVLQGLFARASALPLSDGAPAPTLNAVAPLSPSPVPTATKPRPKRRVAPLAAAAAVTAAAIAWVEYGRTTGAVSPDDVSAVAQRVGDRVGSTLMSGLSAITQRVGLGRLVSEGAEAASVETPAAAAEAPTLTRANTAPSASTQSARPAPLPTVEPASARSSRSPERGASAVVPSQTPAAPVSAAPRGEPVQVLAFDLDPKVRADSIAPAPIERSVVTVTVRQQAVSAPSEDAAVYSSESAGVEPPIAVRPQLPTALPPNVNRDTLIEIELVVSEAGSVDSVRLLGEARNMYDGMWLSAIKAWQFQPAVKGGDAVKYRKTVWIAARR